MRRATSGDSDDLWRGSRLIIALVALGGGLAMLALVRFGPSSASPPRTSLNALVANYDLAAQRPQRFVIGLVTDDQQAVAHGRAQLTFSFLGDEGDPPVPGPEAWAAWQPIPGTPEGGEGESSIGDVNGVYAARDVVFDRAGYWQVDVAIELDGAQLRTDAAFEVLPDHLYLAPGDRAPQTVQQLAGGDREARAIDSRAGDGVAVPDPALHSVTVADAIASGRPTMVLVSTPVYCVSRFCGPITEAVEALAAEFGDRMNFVHLEVWRDFDARELNPAAGEWIKPPGAEEATEPWVWVVDGRGTVVERFDNIASERELADAVGSVLADD